MYNDMRIHIYICIFRQRTNPTYYNYSFGAVIDSSSSCWINSILTVKLKFFNRPFSNRLEVENNEVVG